MDALQDFFFWTWKIGNSTQLNTSSSPMWHYQLGLQQGWIPKGEILLLCVKSEKSLPQKYPNNPNLSLSLTQTDPREAIGHCAQVLSSSQLFDGNFPASATGGVSVLFSTSTLTAFRQPFFCSRTNLYWWSFYSIYFILRLARAHLIPCKAHHTHSPHRQFLLHSQELKFLCYRRIRQQVHWRPCSHRRSQLLQL